MTPTTVENVKQAYDQQGYYIVDHPALPADQVQAAVKGMDKVREGNYDTGKAPAESPWNPGDDVSKLCKIEMPQICDLSIRKLISSPILGEWAAKATGAKMVQVWWVQLLYKPSAPKGTKTPTNVGWHQDMQYWIEWQPGSELFTPWVALSDVTEDAGPMIFVPGSHKWGMTEGGDFFDQDIAGQKGAIKVPQGETWTEVLDTLPAGGFSFHHCHTIHGSGANYSGKPRRSFAIHLRTEKSMLAPGANRVLTRFLDDETLNPVIYGKRQ
jgi:ectoine hydroxylase-related dioxygenase (phytanoyl-CoA dioxygenase family)